MEHKLISSHLQIQIEVAYLCADKTSQQRLPGRKEAILLIYYGCLLMCIVSSELSFRSVLRNMEILNPV